MPVGATVLARLLASSSLYSGAICLLLDPRQHMHPWAFGLPNVAYPRGVPACHEALRWLAAELDRRNAFLAAETDTDGHVHGDVGPRIAVLADSPDLLLDQLRRSWDSERTEDSSRPRMCPSLPAFGDAMHAAATTQVSVLAIGHAASAPALSGGRAGDIFPGTRILGHPTRQLWDRLAAPHPYPRSVSNRPGRVYTVTAAGVTETQIANATCQEARELALAGTVTACPANMPGRQITDGPLPTPVGVSPASGT
jgi:hypothetical protein